MAKLKIKKQAKKVAKESGRQVKQVSKTAKAASKAVKSLTKIFAKKSALSRGKKSQPASQKSAPQKATPKKSSQPKFSKRLTSRKSYSLRDIPIPSHESIIDYAIEIEQHPELDDLKTPGEMWAFVLAGGRSISVYDSINDAASFLSKYQLRQELNENVEAVKFIKLGKRNKSIMSDEEYDKLVTGYQRRRKQAVAKRIKREEKEYQKAREVVEKVTGKKVSRRAEVITGLSSVMEALVKQNEELNKKLAKLQKQVSNVKKASKKSAAKKSAKKSTIKKSAPNKSTTKKAKPSATKTMKPTQKKAVKKSNRKR